VFELGEYEEVFNSDRGIYGGSNVTNEGIIKSIEKQSKDKPYSIKLRIPPLATIYIKPII
jgi:1,4-alpha-glucan branching enzyme